MEETYTSDPINRKIVNVYKKVRVSDGIVRGTEDHFSVGINLKRKNMH